eukprot:9055879-Alexandrium_andersonii.AAC.1
MIADSSAPISSAWALTGRGRPRAAPLPPAGGRLFAAQQHRGAAHGGARDWEKESAARGAFG